uniref:Uncharacterized protein n=1 Tax=Rhizophora mucronata TaxID=61149 RepID=A0A2P2N903_RHIMU
MVLVLASMLSSYSH